MKAGRHIGAKQPLVGAAVLVGLALLASGCGGSSSSRKAGASSTPAASSTATGATSAGPAASTAAKAAGGVSVVVRASGHGRVLFDGRGRVLYLFTRDGRGPSQCYGACARSWPPFIASATPTAAKGASGSLVGTTRRKDGKLQATYAGKPLYYYVSDGPGQIGCSNVQAFGGFWFVVSPRGTSIR